MQGIYTPSRWGAEFHQLSVDEALGAGSAGPGKTMVLLMDPMSQVKVEDERCRNSRHKFPLRWGQSRGWALHLRRTMPMLEQTIVISKRLFPQIDPKADFAEQTHTWTFGSGMRYQFGHCKDIGSWQQYFSNEFTFIGYDELVQFDEEQFTQINSRLRTSDPVLRQMLKIRAMSNPVMHREEMSGAAVRNPHWVRDRFVKPHREGNVVMKRKLVDHEGAVRWWTRIYKPAKLWDNPDKEFVRTYERNLLNMPSHMRRALLEGDWWVTMGSFFGDVWNERLHVCKPFNIPPDWKRFRSMDWGYKAYGVIHWWAMDYDDNLFCEREFSFKGMHPPEVAKEIESIEKSMGLWKKGRSVITGPSDTQLWEERGETSKSKFQEFAECGVNWVQADKKSRVKNAGRVSHRLKDHENGTTTPGLVFFSICDRAIETVPSIGTDPSDIECPLDGGEDHWYDSVAYACAYASHGRQGIPAHQKDDDEFNDDLAIEKPRGRLGYGW